MPGPFPGMDPYLEDPTLWPGVHDGLIYTLSTELNARLPEGYFSRRQTRLYVVQEDRDIIPDVVTFRERPAPSEGATPRAVASATIERPSRVMPRVDQEQVSESFIEIRHKSKPEAVVIIIELLSYANKVSGSVGNHEYRRIIAAVAAIGLIR